MQQPSLILAGNHTSRVRRKSRLRAALMHLAISFLVALLVAVIMFAFWYPYPYREISGGRDLFMLVIAVDVVLGPLLTLAVFDVRKPRPELRRDITVIAVLQIAALAYGLWTVQVARPVHLVFEIDRFRVVHGTDVPAELEDRTPPGIEIAPLTGPTPLSTRSFRNTKESMDATLAALGGVHIGARPDLWEPYAAGRDRILAAAKPAAELKRRFPRQADVVDETIIQMRREAADVLYLPVISRKAESWTVFLDRRTAEILGYLPLDSF